MEKNKESFILSLLCIVFLVAGYLLPAWPFLIALAIAPLCRQHVLFKGERAAFPRYLAFILIPLSAGFLAISLFIPALQWYHGLFYGTLMALSFFIFWLTDRYAPNRLGFFTIMIYWLAMEYVAVKLLPDFAFLLLGSSFNAYPSIIAWTSETGIMGATAWIFLANILAYYVFFKEPGILHHTFRPLTLAYSLILLSIPAIISWQVYSSDYLVTPQDVVLAYSRPEDLPGYLADYALAGEVFGRTAAWVSVLLILYSLVKRKVK